MIGFEDEPASERGNQNEDPETRNLDKRELYLMVQHRFYLPPMNSKGCNREYILKVRKGQVFSVATIDLKRFEVELTDSMLKRIGQISNALLIKKLNVLLTSRNEKPLGFDDYDSPDEVSSVQKTWLYRVARYIDKGNLLEFFEAPVRAEEYQAAIKTKIGRVYYGRLKASKFFFRHAEIKNDKTFWSNLREISKKYKVYLAQKLAADKVAAELEKAKAKAHTLEIEMEDLINRASLTYTKVEKPNFRPDLYLTNPTAVPKELCDLVNLNGKL